MAGGKCITIILGVGLVTFLGYCIYFDQKRHADPQFRRKLIEKRKRRQQEAATSKFKDGTKFPDMNNPEATQKFFLQEIRLGEELLNAGDVDNAVDHLGNAVAVCRQPGDILQVLQQTLDPAVFGLLVQRLPAIASMARISQEQKLNDE